MPANPILQNTKWIVGCRILQSLVQLLIGMLSARYLGPEGYGLISYAASIVAFALPVMQLGFHSTLVQEYVAHSERQGEILGTALVLNLISAAACILGISCFVLAANHGEPETITVCVLSSLSLLFQAVEMLQYWFQAGLKSKYPSLAMLGSCIVVSGYKIFLLVTRKNVYWFALSHSIEYGLIGGILALIYRRVGSQKICFSPKTAGKMLSRSKYYILSGLMVTVFQNTDHIMLKLMVNEAANGYYTTAVTCVGVTGFLYSAVIDSFRPVILAERKRSHAHYAQSLSGLYSLIFYFGLTQSICFTILAEPIVRILYGSAYLQAVPVLRILTWYAAFSYMGSVRNIWILGEGKQHLLWIINLSGACINIGLNALFIPRWGACGAAFASCLTQFFSNFLMGFLLKPIRPNNRLLLQGLDPRVAIETWNQLRKQK